MRQQSNTISSDNDLSLGRHQAFIWANASILLIRTLGANFNETSTEIHIFIQENAFESNVFWKIAAILSRRQCIKGSRGMHIRLKPGRAYVISLI